MNDTVPRSRLGGVVLCGGQSRRMGRPKEWLRADGEYVLVRVALVLKEVAGRVVVAARAGQELPPLPMGVEVVRDCFADAGPLAGLAAGMEAMQDDYDAIILAPCDHPWLRVEFLQRLVEEQGDAPAVIPAMADPDRAQQYRAGKEADSLIRTVPARRDEEAVGNPVAGAAMDHLGTEKEPAHVKRHIQSFPLLGIYRIPVLPLLLESLRRGDYRAAGFARQCGARIVDAELFRDVDPQLESLRNVNTAGDWEKP